MLAPMTISNWFVCFLGLFILGGLSVLLFNTITKKLSLSSGVVSTGIGVFLALCLPVLFILPYKLGSGTWSNSNAQEAGNSALIGMIFVGLSSIFGIVIGIIGIVKKTSSPWLGIIGVFINTLILLVTPLFLFVLIGSLIT